MKKKLFPIVCYFRIAITPTKSKFKFVYDEKMVEYILKNNLSLIRIGDGDSNVILKNKRTSLSKI